MPDSALLVRRKEAHRKSMRSLVFCAAFHGDTHFRISLVADQDELSKVDDKTWHSWIKSGTLTLHKDRMVSVKWDAEQVEIRSHISERGRGVELSELIVFNGKLYTVDDRSGIGRSKSS